MSKQLDWMYKNSNSVDPEEYLLGRSIDKNFEKQSSQNEIEKDILPTSIFSGTSSSVQVDVFRKIKEDPIEQIKQKEIEMRKQILKNPVKLKKLQSLLNAKTCKKDRKEKKKKKKKSKVEGIDDLLAEKYLKLINKYGAKHLVELTKSDSESDDLKNTKHEKKRREKSCSEFSSSEDEARKNKNKAKFHQSDRWHRKDSKERSQRSPKRKSSSRSSGKDEKRSSQGQKQDHLRGRSSREKSLISRRRSSSSSYSSSDGERDTKRYKSKVDHTSNIEKTKGKTESLDSSDEGNSAFKKSYGLVLPKGVQSKCTPSKSHASGESSAKKAETEHKYKRTKPVKLTEEEKKARLKEMMDNAEWRDKERKSNISRYKQDEKREQALEKSYDENFMRNQLSKAAARSVAERIKSNVNHIQRSKFSMDQHFAKRV